MDIQIPDPPTEGSAFGYWLAALLAVAMYRLLVVLAGKQVAKSVNHQAVQDAVQDTIIKRFEKDIEGLENKVGDLSNDVAEIKGMLKGNSNQLREDWPGFGVEPNAGKS